MKDKKLLKIALVCTIIGITALAILMNVLSYEDKTSSELTNKDLDRTIRTTGIVTKVSPRQDSTIIELEQKCKMNIVLFDNFSVEKGSEVEVIGKVTENTGKYSGNSYSLIAEEIQVIK